ncbi:MAG TPA: ABC transporter permease subunit [Acidimicrobiia bacterium]|nr:ABC transporter permease subunit [Acidimicrobiia bacterium]
MTYLANGGWRSRLLRSVKVKIGLGLLLVLTLLAVAHPILRATVWDGRDAIFHPETGHDPALQHPTGSSPTHWLGTDALGRDVMSALTYSLSPALQVAVLAAVLVGALALTVGSLAAYFRGWIDTVTTSLGDALTLMPPTIALLVVGWSRPTFGVIDAGLLFGVLYGLGPAALVIRSRALSVAVKPFVDAARVAGSGARRIMGVHFLPHLVPYAGIQMMSAGIWALASVAFVQYLGATNRARVGLGSMIYSALDFQPVLPSGYGTFNMGDFGARIGWTSLLAAGLAMSLISASFYLLAVGARDAIVPHTMEELHGSGVGLEAKSAANQLVSQ